MKFVCSYYDNIFQNKVMWLKLLNYFTLKKNYRLKKFKYLILFIILNHCNLQFVLFIFTSNMLF